MARVKIPESLEAEVLFKSDLKCCVCRKRGDHIHHIDGNPSNNNIENLVFLCFPHHDEATITNSLRKKLRPKTIIKFRIQHYAEIENDRLNRVSANNKPILQLSEDSLFTASLNSSIIIEILKIKEEYFESENWESKQIVLGKIHKFAEFSTYRINVEIFDFLSVIANSTRNQMPHSFSLSLFSLILSYYGRPRNESEYDENYEFARQVINIGHNIAYDAAIHLNNLRVMGDGLLIIKHVYLIGKDFKLDKILKYVKKIYDELEETCKRPDRNDLNNALEMIQYYKNDLKESGLSHPVLSEQLMTLFYSNP